MSLSHSQCNSNLCSMCYRLRQHMALTQADAEMAACCSDISKLPVLACLSVPTPHPPLRMWPLRICKLPIVPTFCRVHHCGITSGSFVFYVGAFPDVSVFDHRTCQCHFSPVFVRLLPLLRFMFHNFRPCVLSFPRNCIFDIWPRWRRKG